MILRSSSSVRTARGAVRTAQAHPATCACCRTDARRALRRPLTYAETHIDVELLTAALDATKARLRALIELEQRKAARRADVNDPRPLIGVTPAMIQALLELRQLGRLAAIREAASMGVTLELGSAQTRNYARPDVHGQIPDGLGRPVLTLAGYLAQFSDRLRYHAVRTVNTRVAGAERTGSISAGFDARAIMAKAIVDTPGALDAAGRVVSMTLAGGMADIFGGNADAFAGWQYTAVLDGATCPTCEEADGTEYATWDDAMAAMPDGGPNPECDGGDRCRCRLVPIPFGGDQTPPAGDTTPPDPGPPEPVVAPAAVAPELPGVVLPPEPPPAPEPPAIAPPDGSFSSNAYELAIKSVYNAETGVIERQAADGLGVMSSSGKTPQTQKVLEHARADHEIVMQTGRDIHAEVRARVAKLKPRASAPDPLVPAAEAELQRALIDLDIAEELVAELGDNAHDLANLERRKKDVDAARRQLKSLVGRETHYVRIEDIQRVERQVLEERGVVYADVGSLSFRMPTGDPSFDPNVRSKLTKRYRTAGDQSPRYLEAASKRYPESWAQASNSERDGSLKLMQQVAGKDRSHYAPGRGIIALSPKAETSLETQIHELAHRMEASIPALVRAERAFYEWRSRGGSWTATRERARKIYPNALDAATRRETSIFDGWREKYMGKAYPGDEAAVAEIRGDRANLGAFEILSQGMGEVFGASDKGLLVNRATFGRASGEGTIRDDREFMAWLYGVLVHVRP